jgi:hypothetical protein
MGVREGSAASRIRRTAKSTEPVHDAKRTPEDADRAVRKEPARVQAENAHGESSAGSRLRAGLRNEGRGAAKDRLRRDETQAAPEPIDAESEEDISERREASRSRIAFFAARVLAVMMVYTVFLIFGAAVTDYHTDDDGRNVPLVLSVEDIRAANEYRTIYGYYMRARGIYEDALSLDFKLSNHPDDALVIAGEYEKSATVAEKLAVDISAAKFGAEYNQIKSLLIAWATNDAKAYLENVSAAISRNDPSVGDLAVVAREAMYDDFLVISRNIAEYGAALAGVAQGDIYRWSPERYVKETLEGVLD